MTDNIHTSHFSLFSGMSNLTYSTIFPNTPAMINWHNQRCHLSQIRTQWLIDASLHLNHKLKQNPKSYDIALYAITRLDVSNNSLTSIPLAVFQLYSLRYLNIAQNKVEKLPIPAESPVKKTHRRKSISVEELNYNCPVLEELYLQDNRLDHIPEAIFRLPNLITLVVTNNKLQYLPYNMWLAPKLKELNASFNFLKELPISPVEVKCLDCGYAVCLLLVFYRTPKMTVIKLVLVRVIVNCQVMRKLTWKTMQILMWNVILDKTMEYFLCDTKRKIVV